MKTFKELTLDELKRIQTVYYDIIKQIGGLVVSDYNALLVLLPNTLTAEIKIKEEAEA